MSFKLWLESAFTFNQIYEGTTVPPPVPQSKTSTLAVWSLVLGILSLMCFSIFTAIPGVICGHKAIWGIDKSGGGLSGRGLAIAGLVTGYIGIAMMMAAVIDIG